LTAGKTAKKEKNMSKKIVFTSVVGILLTVCLMVSCGDLDVKLPGAAKASAVKSYNGIAPANIEDAMALFNKVINYTDFEDLVTYADARILQDKLGVEFSKYLENNKGKTDLSESISIKETGNLKTYLLYFAGSPSLSVGDTSIKGSNKMSFKSNVTLGNFLGFPFSDASFKWKVGDNYKASASAKRDIKITDFVYKVNDTTSYSISMIFSSDEEAKIDDTINTSDQKDQFDYKSNSKHSSSKALTLSISDGTYSAKYRLSSVYSGIFKACSVQGGENSIDSDIEIYDKDNKLKWTYQGGGWRAGTNLSFLYGFM